MDLWGKGSGNDPEAKASADPIQDMILKMVAKNPAIAEAFAGIQGMLQQFTTTAADIQKKQDMILFLLMQNNAAVLNNLPALPTGEARGVINDGIRCVYCGSAGDCHPDCPSHSDPAFSRPRPVPGSGELILGGSGGGGVGDHNSVGDAVTTGPSSGA